RVIRRRLANGCSSPRSPDRPIRKLSETPHSRRIRTRYLVPFCARRSRLTPTSMIPRALPLLLAAALGLAACGGEERVPEAADVENLRERPTVEQALYLAAYEIGQQVREQDTTFNVDAFLRGLRAGFETDSATALPYALGYQQGIEPANQPRLDSTLSADLGLYVAGFREGYEDRERRLTQAE